MQVFSMDNLELRMRYYEDGVTVEYKEWLKDGQRHRVDGPAFIYYHESGNKDTEEWYLSGQLHRTDGPAKIVYFKDGTVLFANWWIGGEKIAFTDTNSVSFKELLKELVAEWMLKQVIEIPLV